MRSHLVVLVLVAVLPMLIWAAGLTVWSSFQERRAIELGLGETSRALVIAVEQEVRLSAEALETISLSPSLTQGDYEAFHARARQLAARNPDWINLIVVGHSGHILVNSMVPFGEPLPRLTDPGFEQALEAFHLVLETGKPAVSDLFMGPISGRHMVTVAVPVLGFDGDIAHVLMAGILADQLAELLRRQGVAEDWVVAVLDRDQKVIARTLEHDQTVGKIALDWFRNAVEGTTEGVVTGRSLHGRELTFAYKVSPLTGWTVVFAAPREVFLAWRGSAALTGGFGLLVMVVSLALALWVASRILSPVKALSRLADPFVPFGKGSGHVYSIAELDHLHRALDGLSQALAASEHRFRELFATAPVMLEVVDAAGRIREVNDRWLQTLGYSRDQVVGCHPWDFMTPGSRAYVLDIGFPALQRAGAIEDVAVQFVTRSGEVRDVMVSARLEKGADGRDTRIVAALRDVTDQRQAERALAGAIEEAERANDAKTKFMAAASHDLRQPLQALTLYLGVLNARFAQQEPQVLGAVGKCVESLTGLLNDMLDVARLDAGIITPKMEPVPVRQLIDRVAAAWTIQAENKGLALEFVGCDVHVRTDAALMERVLSNLLANAVRYTDKGRILVGCRRQEPFRVRIEVADTGIGIPPDKLETIFEEFRQLGNPERRREKGTGLGLAIVQRIVRLLGHDIQVSSEPGKGSVFAITLPVASAEVAREHGEQGSEDNGPRRILVIEDEPHVRNALELVLTGLGHRVEAAESVDQAVAKAEAVCPQVVIADFRLGQGSTGVDAILAIRTRTGVEVPAVVLTGDTDPATIRRIAGAGMHLLHKPLHMDALRSFLRQVA